MHVNDVKFTVAVRSHSVKNKAHIGISVFTDKHYTRYGLCSTSIFFNPAVDTYIQSTCDS